MTFDEIWEQLKRKDEKLAADIDIEALQSEAPPDTEAAATQVPPPGKGHGSFDFIHHLLCQPGVNLEE